MLSKIARREGCGNLFAEGVKRSAEKIGGEAVKLRHLHPEGGIAPGARPQGALDGVYRYVPFQHGHGRDGRPSLHAAQPGPGRR